MTESEKLLREAKDRWLKHQRTCSAWMTFNSCDCGLEEFNARVDAYLARPDPDLEKVVVPELAPGMLKMIERELHDAEHPVGMSTHDGRTRIPASHVRYLLKFIDHLRAMLDRSQFTNAAPAAAPEVQKWLAGEMDAGGTIAALERALVATERWLRKAEEQLRIAKEGAERCATAIRSLDLSGKEKA